MADCPAHCAAAGGSDAQQLETEPRAVDAATAACAKTGASQARPLSLRTPRRGVAAPAPGV